MASPGPGLTGGNFQPLSLPVLVTWKICTRVSVFFQSIGVAFKDVLDMGIKLPIQPIVAKEHLETPPPEAGLTVMQRQFRKQMFKVNVKNVKRRLEKLNLAE